MVENLEAGYWSEKRGAFYFSCQGKKKSGTLDSRRVKKKKGRGATLGGVHQRRARLACKGGGKTGADSRGKRVLTKKERCKACALHGREVENTPRQRQGGKKGGG